MTLYKIKSIDDLEIDYEQALAIKRGDLAIIQGEVFKCRAAAPHLNHFPLVLKRLDWIDRRIYDLKVYEFDQFMRFRNNPNITTLYTYWGEKAQNPYVYKSLVAIFEEGIFGDMLRSVVLNEIKPSNKMTLKYLWDIWKALSLLHNNNIIHGSVKPSSIYINAKNEAMLGELAKVELDSARHTHQLFSKILIGESMPHTLIYWSPEVLKLEKYTTSADIWSLGVTMYQIATGEHPFTVSNEDEFRDDVLTANYDSSRLQAFPRLEIIIDNCLRVDPEERWEATMVLAFAQEEFVIEIQRMWRGFLSRLEFRRKWRALILIQAHIKGFITKRRYYKKKHMTMLNAVVTIQSIYRSLKVRRKFLRIKKLIMRLQANVRILWFIKCYKNFLLTFIMNFINKITKST